MQDIEGVHKSVVIIIPGIASLASIVNGYFLIYFTMIFEHVRQSNSFNEEQFLHFYFPLMDAALPLGAFIGSFVYNQFVNSLGQKKAMQYLDYLSIIAILIQLCSLNLILVCFSRLIMGFYCAITMALIPSWILSMSPSFLGGILGTFSQIAIVIGMFQVYCMGYFLQDQSINKELRVRLFIALPLLNIIVHLIGIHKVGFDSLNRIIARKENPEIIRFMKTMYGKDWRKFAKELRTFKNEPSIQPSHQNHEDAIQVAVRQTNEQSINFTQRKSPQDNPNLVIMKKIETMLLRKFMFLEQNKIGIMLTFANQFSGFMVIIYYLLQKYKKPEADNINGHSLEKGIKINFSILLYLGSFQIILTLISGFLIDKFGRRIMMLSGLVIIVLSLLFVMVNIGHHNREIVFLFGYILGYSISVGPLFMMYAIETGANIELILQINWFLMLILSFLTHKYIESVNQSVILGIFCVSSIISLIFFCQKMIETKDQDSQENIGGRKLESEGLEVIYSQIKEEQEQNS